MRIGEVARRAGVNVETLRYYERRGLLPEPPRHPSGHRAYGDDAVRFVRALKEAQGLGFTLAEIEEVLRLGSRPAGRTSEAMRVRLASKIDEVDAKIASLRRVRADLARVVGCACDSLDHCTCGAAYLARRGRDPSLEPGDVLHVTNGESAGNTLRQTAIGGAVLSWQDTLTEGPVPDLPPEGLRAVRARFLSECGWGSRRSVLDALERRDRLFLRAVEEGRRVVLWFEHDLYDQLQVLQILGLLREARADAERIEAIQIGAFEGRPDFHGLGELTAAELESLWPSRRPLGAEALELGARAWDAVRAPDPRAVEALVATDVPSLPFLTPALRRLLEQLPAVGSGLSRSERQLLEALAEEPNTPGELFLASQAREEAPFDGDTWVYRRIEELGTGERRLLASAAGGEVLPAPPRGDARAFVAMRMTLTADGRAVLDGRADRVELLGLDRWIGGVHLTPGNVWRWDPAAGRVVPPARPRRGR